MSLKSFLINYLQGLLLLGVAASSTAQSPNIPAQNRNYVVRNQILVPGKTTEAQLNTLTIQETSQQVQYLNGNGRVEQTVSTKGSPQQRDLVSFQIYDAFGREAVKYLPFTSTESNGAFKLAQPSTEFFNFYNSASPKVAADGAPYVTTLFEPNPLDRPYRQGSAGTYWQPATGAASQFAYRSNTSTEVRKWSIQVISTYAFQLNGNNTFYAAGELAVTSATDEQGLTSLTFTDQEGRTVCTKTQIATGIWSETHYVFDDKGDLRFVLPPEAIPPSNSGSGSSASLITENTTFVGQSFSPAVYQYMPGVTVKLAPGTAPFSSAFEIRPFTTSDTSTLSTVTLDALAYQYLYDNQHRKIAEKGPGSAWKYFVYDNRDQLVLSQDGNQRAIGQYSFYKYDVYGRPVLSGILAIAGTIDQIRTSVDSQTKTFEQPGTTILGYTNLAYPQTADINTYLVATYYDNYTCSVCQDPNYQFVSESWQSSSNEPFQKFDRVLGKTVASSVKILGTTSWLHTVTYYNRQGAVIQTIGGNHLGGRDRVSSLYDFSGKKLEELHTLMGYNSGGISTQRKRFDYDHAGRLLNVYHRLNSQWEIVLYRLEYNELGQVVKKSLYSEHNNSVHLQAVDYRYNIRGWPTHVNNLPPDFADPQDYFGMELTYNSTIPNAGNTTRADGLISAIRWKNDLSTKQRLYNYGYDSRKQLASASHKMSATGSAWDGEPNFFDEAGLTYDLNGNIKTLSRNKAYFNGTTNVADPIDQLTYEYGTEGNQLRLVRENLTNSNKDLGFKDGGANTLADPDYTYDANGNVTLDRNKAITSQTYHFNNLPKRTTFSDGSWLENTYDAAGIKLKQEYFKAGTTTTTDYVGGMVLLNGLVLLIEHEEGRITGPTFINLIENKEAASLAGFTPASSAVSLGTASSAGQNYVTAAIVNTTGAKGVYPIKTVQGDTYPVREGDTFTFSILGYQTAVGNMAWANQTNVFIDQGFVISPSPPTTTWSSGAASTEHLPASIDGWTEFSPFGVTISEVAVGLSQTDVNTNWQSIQFGFYVNRTSTQFTYTVIENGVTKTTAAAVTGSDRLRVERVGTTIQYKKNGTVVYTSVIASTTSLRVDIALNGNAYLVVPKISFAAPVSLPPPKVGPGVRLSVRSGSGGSIISEEVKLPNLYTNESFATISFTIPSGITSIRVGVEWLAGDVGSTVYINRVALYKTNFEYNYYLNDQVGNTRVVLQTSPATLTYIATMETENHTFESARFQNIISGNLVTSPGNVTPGGNEAIRLNSTNKMGPAKSLKVYPGDRINASAYSYYTTQGGFTKATTTAIAALVSPLFGGVTGAVGDPGSIASNVNTAYTGGGFALSPDQGTNSPSAFLNYILFDINYKPLAAQSVPVSATPNAPQLLALPEITAQELGYLFIYLSYDNNTGAEVHFDDFKITVVESPVIQVNNYYPFGMVSYAWLREGETENAYLYQGKELIAQTGWHDFGSRMYYGDLGRWFAPDPQNQFGSPYLAMGNMPTMGVDPDGEFFIPMLIGAAISVLTNGISNVANDQGFFKNAGIAALTGAIGGAVSFGIGNAAAGMTGFNKIAFQTLAHGNLGGTMNAATGGDFGSGFLSGAVGSLASTGSGKLLPKSTSNLGKALGTIGTGSITGGITSSISGGNFWDGFRNGAISSSLNHAIHVGALGKGLMMASITGRTRHLFGPDGVQVGGVGDLAFGGAVTGEISIYTLLRGKSAGVYVFSDVGFGMISDIGFSLGLEVSEFYFAGPLQKLVPDTFTGFRTEANLNFTLLPSISIGATGLYSTYEGYPVYAIGVTLTGGASAFDALGLPATFGVNQGWTKIDAEIIQFRRLFNYK
ncbi:MAG: DUF6443 domain-containing protein [Cyclobacteriaceae bacterium]|jgi:RHS repeat-associated protein|nr:DUF6443 domain-containing protein [Flammeovirgaceae bacterium]